MFETYVQYEYLLAKIQLVFFMLGMGATLLLHDFRQVIRQPRSLLFGVSYHLLAVPLIAVFVNYLFGVEAGIAVGLFIIAAMPGGNLAKMFTYLGKGNLALSITMATMTNLAALATIPVLMVLAGRLYPFETGSLSSTYAMEIIRDLILYLLLPLGVGMIVAQRFGHHRRWFARWCIRIGFVFVVVIIAGSVGAQRIKAWDYGWKVPLAIILFCVLAQQFAMAPFRLFGWPRADTFSVGIEVTMRNINLAMLLKALLFPAAQKGDPISDGVLFVILYYAVASLIIAIPLTANFRRLYRIEKESERAAAAHPPPAGTTSENANAISSK